MAAILSTSALVGQRVVVASKVQQVGTGSTKQGPPNTVHK